MYTRCWHSRWKLCCDQETCLGRACLSKASAGTRVIDNTPVPRIMQGASEQWDEQLHEGFEGQEAATIPSYLTHHGPPPPTLVR